MVEPSKYFPINLQKTLTGVLLLVVLFIQQHYVRKKSYPNQETPIYPIYIYPERNTNTFLA